MSYLIYGAGSYVLFLFTFLYLIGFVGDIVVPKSIDSGQQGLLISSIVINVLLIALFGLQHSIMARPWFKSWWTRFVPKPIERSTFVLFTCLVFFLIFWQWRPINAVIWNVNNPAVQALLWTLFAAGWALVLYASFMIDHFDLFGMRQVYLHWKGRPYTHPQFATPPIYRMIRNPLMLGFLIAVWTTPTMTAGHLFFSVTLTTYVLIGIYLEERDLSRILGPEYLLYHQQTPMLVPRLKLTRTTKPKSVSGAGG